MFLKRTKLYNLHETKRVSITNFFSFLPSGQSNVTFHIIQSKMDRTYNVTNLSREIFLFDHVETKALLLILSYLKFPIRIQIHLVFPMFLSCNSVNEGEKNHYTSRREIN
jgi:hypothetical protein